MDRETRSSNPGWVPTGSMACVAFLANAFFAVPVFGDLQLSFGLAVAVLALLFFGQTPALIVAAAASAGALLAGQGGHVSVLGLLEILAISLLLRRYVPVALGALLFWVVIGLPLEYALGLTGFTADTSDQILRIQILVHAVNSLLNASLGSLVFQLLIRLAGRNGLSRMHEIELSRQVFAMVLTLALLPAVIISLTVMHRTVEDFGGNTRDSLERHAVDYRALIELYLDQHLTAISLLAARHREGITPALRQDVEQVQAAVTGFLTLIVVDPEGTVVHGAPVARFRPIMERRPEVRNVSDRAYFTRARDTGLPLISDGIVGRGFGQDPIVPVSAPLFDEAGRFSAVVEASLNLPRLGTVGADRDDDVTALVMDAAGQLVAGPTLREASDATFQLLTRPDFTKRSRHPVVGIDLVTVAGREFLIAERAMRDGWRAVALMPIGVVTEPLEQYFITFGIGVALLVALAAVISQAFAISITRPLNSLSRLVKNDTAERVQLSPSEHNCPEIINVERALDEARQLSVSFRQRVEREIEEKTVQLRAANAALGAQIIEDPLTGITNRRGLEIGFQTKVSIAERERLTMTLAMIDIDHFKRINDEHGHPVGDKCLQQLASRLRSAFRRRGDLVARFGGEEFVVITVAENGDAQVKRLEAFRQAVESHRFTDLDVDVTMTVSIGVVVQMPQPNTQLERLLDQADTALYASKRNGRNRLTVSEE